MQVLFKWYRAAKNSFQFPFNKGDSIFDETFIIHKAVFNVRKTKTYNSILINLSPFDLVEMLNLK